MDTNVVNIKSVWIKNPHIKKRCLTCFTEPFSTYIKSILSSPLLYSIGGFLQLGAPKMAQLKHLWEPLLVSIQ